MDHATITRSRVTGLALVLIAVGAAIDPTLAGEPQAPTSSASRAGDWELRSEMVDGRPVLDILHGAGTARGVTRRITAEEVPFGDADCGLDCRTSALESCYGRCLRGPLKILLIDQTRQTGFVAAPTDRGQNVPWVVFKLDLGSGELTRLGRTFGVDFDQVRSSNDGRYLAYTTFSSRSSADGALVLSVMDTRTGLEVSPIERMYRGQPGNLDVVVDVKNYEWRDASTLVFTAETRRAVRRADKARPRGMATQYIYSVAEDQLMTAHDRHVIPRK